MLIPLFLNPSLTDEKIKENWIKYNHPDGPQSTTMGIALPKWIIEGKNNIWVLGVYGLVFGGALPALVVCPKSNFFLFNLLPKSRQGSWWFGSRQKTKDGINALSAAAFFKCLKEESSMEEVVGTLGKAYKWELPVTAKASDEVDQLEKTIEGRLGSKWMEVRKLAQDYDGQLHQSRREALILLYSHLLRLDIQTAALQKRASISLNFFILIKLIYSNRIPRRTTKGPSSNPPAIERPSQRFNCPELAFSLTLRHALTSLLCTSAADNCCRQPTLYPTAWYRL